MRAIPSAIIPLLLGSGFIAAHAAPTTGITHDVTYELLPDGTSTVERFMVTRINEQVAVTATGQAGIQYSESLQEVEILAAYTTTKDGQRIDVPTDRIITQQSPLSTSAPSFSDYKLKVVIFPQLEIGATTTLHFRQKQLKPFLPDVYSAGEVFSRFTEMEGSKTLTLRAPASVEMNVFGRDLEGGAVTATKPGTREWRWTQAPFKPDVPEAGMVDAASISPGVMFTTLKDYPALMDAYMASAAPMMQVTPAVQKLADQITQGITDRRGQTEALLRWVSGEVRYVAVSMGTGGYVPHSADEVIKAGYGDCKDKTTLLGALMAAKGLRALPALIRTGDRYTWQEVPLLVAFNHVILYLPEFDVYVDPTVSLARLDTLSSSLRGRQVLVAGETPGQASIRQTPPVDASRDYEFSFTVATAAADGSVAGTTRLGAHGGSDAVMRSTVMMIPEQMLPQLGNQMLASTGQTGTAKVVLGDPKDFSKADLMVVEFTVPGRISLPGPGALTGSIGAGGMEPGRSFVTAALSLERKFDFACPAGGSEKRVELTLPPGMKITALPPATDVQSRHGRYTASHEVKDGKLFIVEKLAMTQPATVCTAEDGVELRKFATEIDRAVRRQVLYE